MKYSFCKNEFRFEKGYVDIEFVLVNNITLQSRPRSYEGTVGVTVLTDEQQLSLSGFATTSVLHTLSLWPTPCPCEDFVVEEAPDFVS